MADESLHQLAAIAHEQEGPEVTDLLFVIMDAQRRDAEWASNQLRSYHERRIEELEADNAWLRAQLDVRDQKIEDLGRWLQGEPVREWDAL